MLSAFKDLDKCFFFSETFLCNNKKPTTLFGFGVTVKILFVTSKDLYKICYL